MCLLLLPLLPQLTAVVFHHFDYAYCMSVSLPSLLPCHLSPHCPPRPLTCRLSPAIPLACCLSPAVSCLPLLPAILSPAVPLSHRLSPLLAHPSRPLARCLLPAIPLTLSPTVPLAHHPLAHRPSPPTVPLAHRPSCPPSLSPTVPLRPLSLSQERDMEPWSFFVLFEEKTVHGE